MLYMSDIKRFLKYTKKIEKTPLLLHELKRLIRYTNYKRKKNGS